MTRAVTITPEEVNEEGDYKDICDILNCQERATKQLDLPCGVYWSILLFLCKKCLEKIQNRGNR